MNLKKRNYRSCFKEHLDMFSEYMRASRHWSSGYDSNIRSFDRYCAEQFPDDEGITQEMIDSWCRKRTTETTCPAIQGNAALQPLLNICVQGGLRMSMSPQGLKRTGHRMCRTLSRMRN